jgi:formimidoylglutamate deiminase
MSPCTIDIDERGFIRDLQAAGSPSAERIGGYAIAALSNVHSHAFQRALSGFTERTPGDKSDSFWTWRSRMYALAESITPDDLQAVASELYMEMLEAGMTNVGEFHYLHHDRGGQRFSSPAEMSSRILAAADEAGIGLTHLPVLYLHGGFGRPPLEEQRRFVHTSVSEMMHLFELTKKEAESRPLIRVGLAPHSLRAVTGDELGEAVDAVRSIDRDAPIHMHVAEQEKEVTESVAHLGARPVRYLLDRSLPDEHWCLVHATHVDNGELRDLALSRAVAGLCPTTEANLGDGLFPAARFVAAGGQLAIGSDSHISVSATEELRLLEYGQRLVTEQRNLLHEPKNDSGAMLSVGLFLWSVASRNGARALAQPVGEIAVGRRADLVILDAEHPRLVGHGTATVLDAFVFGGADDAVREVYVAGRRVVEAGRHLRRDTIRRRFSEAMRRIGSSRLMC